VLASEPDWDCRPARRLSKNTVEPLKSRANLALALQ
jgi:hypothetical protein